MKDTINSVRYWDQRFQSGDWEEELGRNQSRFFGQLALENLPQWLKDQIISNELTVCDWGCALGDGADALASVFGKKQVSGVDFSKEAVAKAEAYYPDLNFYASDWIKENTKLAFDIIFSSNTLEHFSNPVDVLDILFRHAKKALILLVPFKELERISEHFSSFLPESIYISPVPQSYLLFAKIIDATRYEPSYWNGEQILLVYGRYEWVNELKLNLDIIQVDIKAQQAHQNNANLIDELNEELKEYTQKNTLLTNAILESNNQIKSLTADLLEERHNAQALQIQIVEDKNQIQGLTITLQEKSAAIEQFKQQLSNYKKIIQETKERLINKEQAVEVLTGKLSTREQMVKTFEEKLIEQERVTKTFEEELIEQERVTKSFEEKLIEQERVTKTFEEKLIEQERVTKTFEEKLIEQERVAKELNIEIAKEQKIKQFYEKELSSIKTSRGWRLLWSMWQVRLFFVPKNSWQEFTIKKIKKGLLVSPLLVIKKVITQIFRKNKHGMSPHAFAFKKYKLQRNEGCSISLRSLHTPSREGLVSIVLPVYNGADLLSDAIDSILGQTYSKFELIAVNDGSQDATRQILDEYAKKDQRIKVIHQENQKLPSALNRGFSIADGEFLTWTSHDNLMRPKFLEKMVKCLKQHSSWDMVYSNMDIIGEQGEPLRGSAWYGGYQHPPGSEHIYLPKSTLELNTYPNNFIGGAFMYRQRVPWLIGDYSLFRYTREDYDYWMRVNALLNLKHSRFKDRLYYYRFHSTSLTQHDEELGITRDRYKLMVFDDFRRDFFLMPLTWFIETDIPENQDKKIAEKIRTTLRKAGHLILTSENIPPSLWPRLWVPVIYLKITSTLEEQFSKDNLPTNVFAVLLNVSASNLPHFLNGEWDLYTAYGKNANPPKINGKRKGWITSPDVEILFTAIDIRSRTKHLELVEKEIYQPKVNQFKISVIICTYQRGEKLRNTLDSVVHQTFPKDSYEVIVVNNDPDDANVAEIVARIQTNKLVDCPDHIQLRVCPILGLSYARNSGISESRGEILLFLDDDSIAKENLLEEYWKAFSEHPSAGVIGGHIVVHPPHPLNIPWKDGFERYWGHLFTDYEEYTEVSDWWEYPWGANWAARRSAMFQAGGFRTKYGRRGHDFSGGEEIIAASVIKKLGYSIAILPQAEVIHQVAPDRFTLNHLKNTIRAGLNVQYQAEKDLYLPLDASKGGNIKQLVENVFELLRLFFSTSPAKMAELLEAYYYFLARWRLFGRNIQDTFQIRFWGWFTFAEKLVDTLERKSVECCEALFGESVYRDQ